MIHHYDNKPLDNLKEEQNSESFYTEFHSTQNESRDVLGDNALIKQAIFCRSAIRNIITSTISIR